MSPTNYFDDSSGSSSSIKAGNWTLADIYNDIVTTDMIARELNVTHKRVVTWLVHREKINCPQPIRRVAGRIYLFSMEEWRDWYENWLRTHENNRTVTEAKTHGHGESFWSYFEDDA